MRRISWKVKITPDAIAMIDKEVPTRDKNFVYQAIIDRLSFGPNVIGGSIKKLVPNRQPLFPGKDVWQLSLRDYRVFYEILTDVLIVAVFFVAKKKGTETTADMYHRVIELYD